MDPSGGALVIYRALESQSERPCVLLGYERIQYLFEDKEDDFIESQVLQL